MSYIETYDKQTYEVQVEDNLIKIRIDPKFDNERQDVYVE